MAILFSKQTSTSRRYTRSVSVFKERALHSNRGTVSGGWRWLAIDKTLAIIVFALLCAGLIFTYSSSAFDSISYFKRQLIFDILGVVVALFLSQTYTRLQELIKPIWLMYGTWLLLFIVLFTEPIANVHRWIPVGPFNLQPSEIAKVTYVIYLADYLSQVQGRLARDWRLLLKPLVVGGITFALIMKAPDLGTVILMGGVMMMMLFVAGALWRQLAAISALGLPILVYQLIFYAYRLKRLLSFWDPEAQVSTTGYQVSLSFWAIGSGGWFGKGLGNSELKLEYLPAAHTDFIFSVLCEETGLIGALVVILLFCLLLVRGISLARVCKNTFHSLLLFGLTLTICAQAFFNMSMAIGLIPPKGIPLPFFSYGGSSVIMTLVMVGIMVNVAAQSATSRSARAEDMIDYRPRRR